MAKLGAQRQKRDVFLRKSERLKKEIEDLVSALYNTNEKDTRLRLEYLKTYRTEVQRSFVLHMHLAIENLLRALLFDFLAKRNRRLSKKDLIKAVDGIWSAELIHWCGRLRLIKPKWYERLIELNRIRNACSHNWILDIPKHKRAAGGQPQKRIKVPVVTYKDKNLLNSDLLLHDFCPTYGRIYVGLLGIVWKLQGKI